MKDPCKEAISYLRMTGYEGDLTTEDPRLRHRVSDIIEDRIQEAYVESEQATFDTWARMGYEVRPLSTEELRERLWS